MRFGLLVAVAVTTVCLLAANIWRQTRPCIDVDAKRALEATVAEKAAMEQQRLILDAALKNCSFMLREQAKALDSRQNISDRQTRLESEVLSLRSKLAEARLKAKVADPFIL